MPSVLVDQPPALYESERDSVRKHMNTYHASRKAFTGSERDERIRRALRHNIRTYADTRYSNGDKVWYLRNGFNGWKGPAVVLGQDGQFVAIRHGGEIYRCHPCQLRLMSSIPDNHRKVPEKSVKSTPLVTEDNANSSVNLENDSEGDQPFNDSVVQAQDLDVDEPPEPQVPEPQVRTGRPVRNSRVRYKLINEN